MEANTESAAAEVLQNAETIERVLKDSRKTTDTHFPEYFDRGISHDEPSTLPDLRAANLFRTIDGLRTAIKVTRPFLEDAAEFVARLDQLYAKYAVLREQLKNINVAGDVAAMRELQRSLKKNKVKSACVARVEKHLNPELLAAIDACIEEDDVAHFTQVLKLAEDLRLSRNFCNVLRGFDDLLGSPFLAESLDRIEDKIDRVTEACRKWLCKQTQKFTTLSPRVSSDSGIINEPLINLPESEDTTGIVSIFETGWTDSGRREAPPEAPAAAAAEPAPEGADPLSLRALRIVALSPQSLARFLREVRSILVVLAHRRFSLLLQHIKVDFESKNNALYDVFMNLQLVVSMVKSSVVSLYVNAGLDLYDRGAMSAPEFINDVTESLVLELRAKLDQILTAEREEDAEHEGFSRTSSVSSAEARLNAPPEPRAGGSDGEEGPELCLAEILDLYTAIQICHFYYNKMLSLLRPPYLYPAAPDGPDAARDWGLDFDAGQNAILRAFKAMCDQWNDRILATLERRVAEPLASSDAARRLSPPAVIGAVSKFLGDVVAIQLEYSGSDDLLVILEMTLNPVINWCQKVANDLGDGAHLFLVSAFASLLNAIQSPLVNTTFKLLLEELIDASAAVVARDLFGHAVAALGGRALEGPPPKVECEDPGFPERVRELVYTDGLQALLPEDVARDLAELGPTTSKLVLRRAYVLLAEEYRLRAPDEAAASELTALASAYE